MQMTKKDWEALWRDPKFQAYIGILKRKRGVKFSKIAMGRGAESYVEYQHQLGWIAALDWAIKAPEKELENST